MEKIIKDFPMYKINDKGIVFSRYKPKTGVIWDKWTPIKWVLDKSTGYFLVTLCNKGVCKNQFIHRLLAQAFISNPENKPQVNHIDGNKQNNDLSNLEWVTAKENTHHAIKIGLTTFNACKKPIFQCDKDTHDIIKEFPSTRDAYRATGIAYQNISKVLRGLRPKAGGFYWKYKL